MWWPCAWPASCAQSRRFADAAAALDERAEPLPVALSHMQVNRALGLASAYTRAVDAFVSRIVR